jgi:hypothetical protein
MLNVTFRRRKMVGEYGTLEWKSMGKEVGGSSFSDFDSVAKAKLLTVKFQRKWFKHPICLNFRH